MRKTWLWTKHNRVFVGVMAIAGALTWPGSDYALKTLPGILPDGVWNPHLAPFAVSGLVFSLVLKIVIEAHGLAKKYVAPNVRRGNFPRFFCALGMFWPKRISLEVWQPALEDEMARYYDLKPRSDLRILNACFAWRMIWVILSTILITLTDWRLVFLSRKKPE